MPPVHVKSFGLSDLSQTFSLHWQSEVHKAPFPNPVTVICEGSIDSMLLILSPGPLQRFSLPQVSQTWDLQCALLLHFAPVRPSALH